MKQTHTVFSPSNFLVEEYSPGFTIDFREPAITTDIEQLRRSFNVGQFSISKSESELSLDVGRALVALGITEDEEDFSASLYKYTGEKVLKYQLNQCLRGFGMEQPPEDLVQSITLLLKKTNCLEKNLHHPLRLYCHFPGTTSFLEERATHYGYVLKGECVVKEKNLTVTVGANSFFCIAGNGIIEGKGECVLITRFNYQGITLFGGEVEDWGRLAYIDGCTDTLLISPLKKGDPCLNALYFPPSTQQTRHTHPSVRCGVITSGEGVCKTPDRDYVLKKGNIFFLPPETYHSFHTYNQPLKTQSALTVLAFHPDSDFGPTDTDHPMINRTYFKFLHRLIASKKATEVYST